MSTRISLRHIAANLVPRERRVAVTAPRNVLGSTTQHHCAEAVPHAEKLRHVALKLGIEVSQATVGSYLPWRLKVPSPSWRSFRHNHLTDIAAIDMFVVTTATFVFSIPRSSLDMTEEESSISRSPKIQHKSGYRAK